MMNIYYFEIIWSFDKLGRTDQKQLILKGI